VELFKNGVNSAFDYTKVFLKWLFFASIVGVVGGTVGSVFHISIDDVTELSYEFPWILFHLQ